MVFTKLDLLVGMLNKEAMEDGELLDDATVEKLKLESLEKHCLAPVEEAAKAENVSLVPISST